MNFKGISTVTKCIFLGSWTLMNSVISAPINDVVTFSPTTNYPANANYMYAPYAPYNYAAYYGPPPPYFFQGEFPYPPQPEGYPGLMGRPDSNEMDNDPMGPINIVNNNNNQNINSGFFSPPRHGNNNEPSHNSRPGGVH